jgi:hypothetical protein
LRKHKRQISQKEAIERLFETSDGKLLLEYLSDLLLFDVGNFCPNSNAMFFREGRRSVLTNLPAVKDMAIGKYLEEVKKIQVNRIGEEEDER